MSTLQHPSNSQVKTGEFNPENSLINLPKGVKLYICSQLDAHNANASSAMALIKSSVLEWARTIDFETSIKIEEGCPSAEQNLDATITVSYSPQTDPNSDVCVTFGANYVVFRNTNLAWALSVSSYKHNIVLCDPSAQVTKDLILHEVGHLFGNCDQYKIESGNSFATQRLQHPNCGSQFGSGKGECSAMNAIGSDHPQSITQADCEIMQQMGKFFQKRDSKEQGDIIFKAKCAEYPGPEKCGITSDYNSNDNIKKDQQPQNECPAGYSLASDGYCYPNPPSQKTCPPGTVLYTDGSCR